MIENLLEKFRKKYNNAPGTERVFFSPGRVNLIGEHTDYNGGYVFPCSLSYGTYLVIQKNDEEHINFISENFTYATSIPLEKLGEKQESEWVNYPLGVIEQLMKKGLSPVGMDLYFSGNIPNGAGLSSSASVELVTAFALNELYKLGLDVIELVKLSQKAENEFVGVNCGIMDQFAVGMGKAEHALFLNCETLEYEHIPAKLKDYKLVISNTNKRRGLADSKYNERRSECDTAVKNLSTVKPIKYLSDLSLDEFTKIAESVKEPVVRRRAHHVISENARVLEATSALRNGDLEKFGELMNESHNSLRDDYEVTGKELDAMVENARRQKGVLGSRMTGAGFGGCTVSLVHKDEIENFRENVGKGYRNDTGLTADFYIAEIGEGTVELGK